MWCVQVCVGGASVDWSALVRQTAREPGRDSRPGAFPVVGGVVGRGKGATDLIIYIYIYILSGRGEGATDQQLLVVAEAKAEGFVWTKRLEEDWPGYSWRSLLSPGYFGLLPPLPPPPPTLSSQTAAGSAQTSSPATLLGVTPSPLAPCIPCTLLP